MQLTGFSVDGYLAMNSMIHGGLIPSIKSMMYKKWKKSLLLLIILKTLLVRHVTALILEAFSLVVLEVKLLSLWIVTFPQLVIVMRWLSKLLGP
ncbi:hypothetical protein XX41_23235, partial [Salmonella enterica subsp. enterica]|nr:hypothetical protein [Salmonella enterica subsp. enterica]